MDVWDCVRIFIWLFVKKSSLFIAEIYIIKKYHFLDDLNEIKNVYNVIAIMFALRVKIFGLSLL